MRAFRISHKWQTGVRECAEGLEKHGAVRMRRCCTIGLPGVCVALLIGGVLAALGYFLNVSVLYTVMRRLSALGPFIRRLSRLHKPRLVAWGA